MPLAKINLTKFLGFRRRFTPRNKLYNVQPLQSTFAKNLPTRLTEKSKIALRLPPNLICNNWPYRDSWNPYAVTTALDWHGISHSGRWDIPKIIRDFEQYLRHSRRSAEKRGATIAWDETVFVLAPDLWFGGSASFGNNRDLQVWASSLDKAEREMDRLKSRYLLPEVEKPEIDDLWILTVSAAGIEARRVALHRFYLSDEELNLNYGANFRSWHREFVNKVSEAKIGLTILQGPPGTGKTSYLRHLLHELRATHRFYYLPVTVYPMLAAPAAVDFWVSENTRYEDKLKVAIIEDAETLLMERASDNHDSLSNLLNLADGFLGAFLKLHLICTINTPIEKLDPAVMRPGRLLARQTFNRLTPQEAQTLAAVKGLKIRAQESYSLAEIYNGDSDSAKEQPSPRVGFC
jgi:ATPase family associated with various cellular activities (AAA)